MTWLSVSSLIALVVVLGVAFWRAYRRNGHPTDGQRSLQKAERMREAAAPLIHENRRHLQQNSFTPLIKHALGRE